MSIRRSCLIGTFCLCVACPASTVTAFSGNYHEALAYCWWRIHCPDTAPTEENGGIYFLLAASGADIRGTSMNVKPLASFPDAWSKINWRNFHTAKGSMEFLARVAPMGLAMKKMSFVLKEATPAALAGEFQSGKMLTAVAINDKQRWIARGWAFHNLTDYIGVVYRLSDSSGATAGHHPDNVVLHPMEPTDTRRYLDNVNDTLSALWVGLPDVGPETFKEVSAVFADPKRAGRVLGEFAFVLQRGYDRCGADDLAMASCRERAQKVMLPVVNEFAHGYKITLFGKPLAFGWGFCEHYAERAAYAREVVLPELFQQAAAQESKQAK